MTSTIYHAGRQRNNLLVSEAIRLSLSTSLYRLPKRKNPLSPLVSEISSLKEAERVGQNAVVDISVMGCSLCYVTY